MSRTRVAVVFGGMSPEHSISCLTAANVVAATDTERFEVVGIGITRHGAWTRWQAEEILALPATARLPVVDDSRPGVALRGGPHGCQMVGLDADARPLDLDVAFPLLHGPYGEDGTIQGLFEMNRLRYVGCGVAASAQCMDKHLTKVLAQAAGIPVGPWVVVEDHEWTEDRDACLARLCELTFPLFVKPARGGSSLGISRVERPQDLPGAVEEARRHDPKVVVEQRVVGREIECSVLGGRHGSAPRASLPGEIIVHDPDGFYDFDAKYLTGSELASVAVPADLDAGTVEKVQQVALDTFRALGCEGLARIDTFVTPEGRVLLNEPNTMPGFTRTSGFPLMWQASGTTYPQIITELLDLALERPLGLR